MRYKTCQVIHENFLLDDKSAPYFNGANKKIFVTDGLEKGYIYASLFFYDEVQKEITKLEKEIRSTWEAVLMDAPEIQPGPLMVEISRRVKDVIGDDSLDALIKEILAEKEKHISLVPDEKEKQKYDTIRDSILAELLASFYDITIKKAEQQGPFRTIKLSDKYVTAMTERQKKLFSPAVRMVGFLNNIRLEDYVANETFEISYKPERLLKPFDAQEEIIKNSLKKLIADNS